MGTLIPGDSTANDETTCRRMCLLANSEFIPNERRLERAIETRERIALSLFASRTDTHLLLGLDTALSSRQCSSRRLPTCDFSLACQQRAVFTSDHSNHSDTVSILLFDLDYQETVDAYAYVYTDIHDVAGASRRMMMNPTANTTLFPSFIDNYAGSKLAARLPAGVPLAGFEKVLFCPSTRSSATKNANASVKSHSRSRSARSSPTWGKSREN